MAALASMVEASTPTRLPLIRPCSASRSSTQANTCFVDLERQPRPGPAQPGVIRHALVEPEAEEVPQREAVGAAPLQPALAGDPFEVADQMHPEVPPRRQRRRPRRVA